MGERLDGTVALVTGASSGIGEATARALAAQGAAVAVAARRKDRLDALVTRIGDDGGRALAIEADVTEQEQATRAVERTVERARPARHAGQQRRRDAARPDRGRARSRSGSGWSTLNVLGLLYCAHAALPHLLAAAERLRARRGRHGQRQLGGGPASRAAGCGVYNATKHGVGAFSESLRQEVTERHVRVSLVEPGAVATELAGHNRAGDPRAGLRALRRRGAPRRPTTSPTRSPTSSPGRGASRSTRC